MLPSASSLCCKEGDPFQRPKLGFCLALGNELSEETHALTKQEILLGKGTRLESSRVREPRRTALHVTCSLRFLVLGLVSRLSLASNYDSESFLVVPTLFSHDGCHRGFWEVVGHVVSPFGLSPALPVGGDLLVPCSLPGPLVLKQLMQRVTMVPGQGGRFHSVCFP